MDNQTKNASALKVGIISSWALALLTIVTFGLAMIATPPTGPWCTANCMDYPYSNLLNYFPRDYFWMNLAIVQMAVFLIFTIAHHFLASEEKKIYSFISVAFALMASLILMTNYHVQSAVIPISMLKNQPEGIALLTQYNGHGIFIAVEEMGFTLMSLAFLFLSFTFPFKTRLEKALRVVLSAPFIANVLIFIVLFVQFGIDRDYRYEVAAITSDWLAAIAVGILAAMYLMKSTRKQKRAG
jgi:hypothetical protein